MATRLRELALPPGAQRIFGAVLPMMLEFVAPEHFLLGGGTALAARWQHRDSLDIDLFTSPQIYTQLIYRQSERINARLKNLASCRIATFGPQGCTIYLEGGKAEIVAVPAQTEHSRSGECTASPRIGLETTLEILAKKLHRRMIAHGMIIPRDLYDMAVGRRFEPETVDAAWSAGPVMDPGVLVAALSSFSPGWIERHEEPVVNPRYPDLRDSAVQGMLDDVLARFPQSVDPWRR